MAKGLEKRVVLPKVARLVWHVEDKTASFLWKLHSYRII